MIAWDPSVAHLSGLVDCDVSSLYLPFFGSPPFPLFTLLWFTTIPPLYPSLVHHHSPSLPFFGSPPFPLFTLLWFTPIPSLYPFFWFNAPPPLSLLFFGSNLSPFFTLLWFNAPPSLFTLLWFNAPLLSPNCCLARVLSPL